jgi:hypothetical protein
MTADDAVTVLLPIDPPELSSGAARILLEILPKAVEELGGMSPSTGTMTLPPKVQEIAR